MATKLTPASPYRPLIAIGSLVLIVAALYFAQKFIVPLALAGLLAFILSPAVAALQRRGLGRVFAVLLVVILTFGFLAAIGSAISLQIRSLASELPQRKDAIVQKITRVMAASQNSFFKTINTTIQDVTKQVLAPPDNEPPAPPPVPVRLAVSPLEEVRQALEPAAEALATAGMIVVLVIFILIKREDLRNRLVRLVGHGRLILTTRAIDEAGHRISRYLLMQLLINSAFAVTLGLGLFFLRVPYALLWGFLAGTLRFVPYVGTWLAALLIVGFSVAISDGWTQPILVVLLFGTVELLTFNVLEPLLFGHSTGISSVALLVAAAFWTWLWGPIGLILSTPLTACLVVLGKYVPQLEFFSVLLGDEPVLDAEVTFYQRLLAHDHDEAEDLVETHLQTQPVESVYDEVLIPSLVLAKKDRESGELTPEDEEFILQSTRDILNDLVSPQQQVHVIATKGLPADQTTRSRVLILGCPARDEEDDLALEMFRQMMQGAPCEITLLSPHTLAGELLQQVEELQPALLCIAALPPGSLSLTRYLCKRVRAQYPTLKIAVGRWGQEDNLEVTKQRLLAAGADWIGHTLRETRDQIIPIIQTLAHATPPPGSLEAQPAGATA